MRAAQDVREKMEQILKEQGMDDRVRERRLDTHAGITMGIGLSIELIDELSQYPGIPAPKDLKEAIALLEDAYEIANKHRWSVDCRALISEVVGQLKARKQNDGV